MNLVAPNAETVSVDHTMYFVLDDQMNLAKLKTFVVLFLLQNFSLDSNNFVVYELFDYPSCFFLKYLKQTFTFLSTISLISISYRLYVL